MVQAHWDESRERSLRHRAKRMLGLSSMSEAHTGGKRLRLFKRGCVKGKGPWVVVHRFVVAAGLRDATRLELERRVLASDICGESRVLGPGHHSSRENNISLSLCHDSKCRFRLTEQLRE